MIEFAIDHGITQNKRNNVLLSKAAYRSLSDEHSTHRILACLLYNITYTFAKYFLEFLIVLDYGFFQQYIFFLNRSIWKEAELHPSTFLN